MFGLLLAAALAAAQPDLAFVTSSPPAQTQSCIYGQLKGMRLGLNPVKLKPHVAEVFEGYVITIDVNHRVTIGPVEGGSEVKLYATNWKGPLSEAVRACRN